MTQRLFLAALVGLLGLMNVRADVKPHPLFSDGAVLQRGCVLPVWGTADPGEKVAVNLTRHGKGPNDQAETVVKTTVADAEGRWQVELPAQQASQPPCTLVIAGNNRITLNNVLIGEVWICSGQSNMEWPMRLTATGKEDAADATNPLIRLFKVPHRPAGQPQATVAATWQPCTPEAVLNFSAVGYYFGRDLQKALKVPVGLIQTTWGGTRAEAWTSRPSLENNPQFTYLLDSNEPNGRKRARQHVGAALYNGMVAPLIPYAFRGVIWYQGESNAGRAYEYRTLFATMIRDWRKNWKRGDFPFLLVQLAPFRKIVEEPQESNWAELREAQLMATQKLPKVAMAVITDVGEEDDIHPRKKEPVGARLALAAQVLAYDRDIPYSGPVFKAMDIKDGKVILSFDHVDGGLEARGGPLTGFTIAGKDRKFVNAEAVIDGEKVIVSSEAVDEPVAVRFGWANYPVVNLWNKAGLPATPFRTDDWPGVTAPKADQ